jgi:hypothetical protein
LLSDHWPWYRSPLAYLKVPAARSPCQRDAANASQTSLQILHKLEGFASLVVLVLVAFATH